MFLIKKLLEKGLVDKEKAIALEYETKQLHKKEEDLLLEKGIVSEDILFNLKSEVLNVPMKEVDAEKVSLETLEIMSEETAKYYQMISLYKEDNYFEVGMVYPEDLEAQEAVKFLARQGKFDYKIYLITPKTFKNLIRQYSDLKKEVGKALKELETELKVKEEKIKIGNKSGNELQKLSEDAPITKIVAVMLRHAVEGGASDIHVEPTKDKVRVRFRLLGKLHASLFLPLETHAAVVARVKILSNLKIDETRIPQDGRFSTTVEGKSIDFRVSTFPTSLGEKIAIRVLNPDTGIKNVEDLGMEERNLKLLKDAVVKPYGLILVTGPTGSGKSTTLYATLKLLNKEGANIVTLEDPVEYFMEGVNQSQIRPEINYNFSTGLRHILRQDPNVIMVGEIRDEETANLVIHAALTGHVVLSTLHTSNTLGAVPRLVDLGVKSYLIPPSLRLALAQRLVRRLCDRCKKKVIPSKEMEDLLSREFEELPVSAKKDLKIKKPFSIFSPVGCAECNNTGYSGRLAIYEILSMTPQLSDIILQEPSENNIMKEAKRQEMVTMKRDGIIKILKGLTTIEEVLNAAEGD